jgi:hypothetical protein
MGERQVQREGLGGRGRRGRRGRGRERARRARREKIRVVNQGRWG